jgi:hypothetical protein
MKELFTFIMMITFFASMLAIKYVPLFPSVVA